MGIREVGRQVARVLADRFGTFEKLQRAGEDELTAIDSIGPVIAAEIRSGLADKSAGIKRLLKRVTLKRPAKQAAGPLADKKFCFTGEMAAMKRSEGQKRVEALGGITTNSVTKDLDYLVVGSEGGAGSKLNKAQKYSEAGTGIQIIKEKQFLKLIGS